MSDEVGTAGSIGELIGALRAAAEPSRLRLLVLCSRGELTVTELAQILGQSQPRVSRHLKLLCDAGLLDRAREGSWVFYRLGSGKAVSFLSRYLVDACGERDETVALDLQRLAAIKRHRAELAAAYFRDNAAHWHRIRSLYVDEAEVETVLVDFVGGFAPRDLLDVGTGTGRMLELFGPLVANALGIDQSREMLAVARVNIERAGLSNCMVRLGDMYQLPLPDASFDAAVIHQVLHYADRPAEAIAEAARVLRPGGGLIIVDFAPHALEFLRDEHAHCRLGFGDDDIAAWCRAADLEPGQPHRLTGNPLTVVIWTARRRPVPADPSSATAHSATASAQAEPVLQG